MSAPPFKVKAVYDYTSPHDDDLNFSSGQLITVVAEEDADWYMGEYTDGSGEKKQGLFPKNFVERYEPKTPPRPVRILRPREENEVPPPPPEATEREAPARPSEEIQDPMETGIRGPVSAPTPVPQETPKSALLTRAAEIQAPAPELPPAPKPAPVASAAPSASGMKAPPPAVADKPSSFKDRIAAFNKAAAPPVAPFKPPAAAATGFIKKPFVAAPPSRNSYVPPAIQEPPPQKIYRREEDPEIVEREAEDQAIAEKAGLVGHDGPQEGDESAKPTSLKDRIALLQKQQLEQAQRRADVTQKEKPKPPPKKQAEARESAEMEGSQEGAVLEQKGPESRRYKSVDIARESREPSVSSSFRQGASRGPRSPEIGSRSDTFSDGNEADQSAAGETTEEPEGLSSDAEDAEEKRRSGAHAGVARAPAAPAAEPDVGSKEDTTEDDVQEEDDMDAETRRRMELRERMAKMSGGMGMAGMFGPPGAMPMPGAGPLRKKKPTGDSEAAATASTDTASTSPPPLQWVQMVPIPGMQRPKSPAPEEAPWMVEKEEPALPTTEGRGPQEVPDVEELQREPGPRAQYAEGTVPPPVPQERSIPAPPATIERGVPPPVPGNRPGPPPTESSAMPPTLAAILRYPSPGSASDDEVSLQPGQSPTQPMSGDTQLPVRGAPPPVPSAAPTAASLPLRPQGPRSPQPPASKRASYFAEPAQAVPPTSPTEKRSSRVPPVPPVPLGSPAMSSPSLARPPPPPPPTAAPPRRASTTNEQTHEESDEGETEYEGDYDTDIASGATHKEALKSYERQSSYDSTTADESSERSPEISAAPPPLPGAGAPRAVPPPPPPHVAPRDKRQSMEPRPAPPPIPSRDPAANQDDSEYDPYRYSSASTGASTDAPSPLTRLPEAPVEQDGYSGPSVRRSMETTHGMQSQTGHQHDRPPPLPPAQLQSPVPPVTHPRISSQMPRQSLDIHRSSTSASRRSMDQSRSEHGFIAADVDIGEASQWWSVPNTPPPVLQGRMGKDILYEIEESSTSKRGGKTMISRDVYVLYMDYSQSTITALFDAQNPADVIFEQRHKGPPPRLRQDQLEEAYRRFGARIADAAAKTNNVTVGDGSPHGLVLELLKAFPDALHPVGTRAYGALVYANLANASVQQFDEIRPGDVMTLRNVKLQGKHGNMHKNYSLDVGTGGRDHAGIVLEWDGTKKKVRMLEQGRDAKDGKKGKVQIESYKLGDLKSGEVKVWRVIDRGWVGWEGSN